MFTITVTMMITTQTCIGTQEFRHIMVQAFILVIIGGILTILTTVRVGITAGIVITAATITAIGMVIMMVIMDTVMGITMGIIGVTTTIATTHTTGTPILIQATDPVTAPETEDSI